MRDVYVVKAGDPVRVQFVWPDGATTDVYFQHLVPGMASPVLTVESDCSLVIYPRATNMVRFLQEATRVPS